MPPPYSKVTKDISEAVQYLRDGRVVAFPSGTSYGLAVDALQGFALQRLKNLKGRPSTKTFTVFMSSSLWPHHLDLTDQEQNLLNKLHHQPLTLLVKPRESLAHLAQDNLIGLRVIDHPLMEKLSQAIDVPLTATSANRSDQPPCNSPDCIQSSFPGLLPDDQIDEDNPGGASQTTYDLSLAAILDAGTLPDSQSTTIATIQNGQIKIIRPGLLTTTDLQAQL